MRTYLKRALALVVVATCVLTSSIAAFARTTAQAHNDVLVFLAANVTAPTINAVGGEWVVFALARGGATVPGSYYDDYINHVRQTLQNHNGNLPGPTTEFARVVIALSALGIDVTNMDGHNLLLPLADFYNVTAQGINGATFALIAFDTRNWTIPVVANTTAQVTRERLVEFILGREIPGGGFALGAATAPAADVTAMVLQALAPYRSQTAVSAAIDRALAVLSGLALENAESAAQVIVALTALGIAPAPAQLRALLDLQQPNGSFFHVATGTGNTQMATEQAAYALVAYERFVHGQAALYNMSDVTPRELPPLQPPEPPGTGTSPWWYGLSVWLQWLLRIVFFGWIWM